MFVCCLATQNVQAGSVGRKERKDTILRLNYLKIEAKNKNIGSGKGVDGTVVGGSVNNKQKYF